MLNTKHEQQIKCDIGIDVVVKTSVNYKLFLQKKVIVPQLSQKHYLALLPLFFPNKAM